MQRRTSVSSMGGASGAGSGQGNSGSTSGNGADSRQALAHKRAAHGGSGSNTEMRAILRRERELERQRETEALRKGLNSRNSESRLSASGYDEDSARSRTLSRSTGPGAQQGNLAGRTSKDSQIGKEPQQQHAKLSPPDSFDHSVSIIHNSTWASQASVRAYRNKSLNFALNYRSNSPVRSGCAAGRVFCQIL